jgi:hypothetical protein
MFRIWHWFPGLQEWRGSPTLWTFGQALRIVTLHNEANSDPYNGFRAYARPHRKEEA